MDQAPGPPPDLIYRADSQRIFGVRLQFRDLAPIAGPHIGRKELGRGRKTGRVEKLCGVRGGLRGAGGVVGRQGRCRQRMGGLVGLRGGGGQGLVAGTLVEDAKVGVRLGVGLGTRGGLV